VFTVATALLRGRRASVFAAFGCTAGIVPHLLATVLGLAALMHASAIAFQMLKYAGVVYLLYLAYATWRDKSAFAVEGAPSAESATGIVVKAILLNLLNPKLTIFFLAFLPQFVEAGTASPLARMLLLSGVFMAMTFVVFVIYGLLAHAFRRVVIERRAYRHGCAAASRPPSAASASSWRSPSVDESRHRRAALGVSSVVPTSLVRVPSRRTTLLVVALGLAGAGVRGCTRRDSSTLLSRQCG
jgi:threonine/homoserine/homoserine lactone efflux protein